MYIKISVLGKNGQGENGKKKKNTGKNGTSEMTPSSRVWLV